VLGDEVDECREHGLVDRAIVGRMLARTPTEPLHELVELRVHVVPLAQARERQVLLLRPDPQRALAAPPLVPVRVPNLQIGREVGARVRELLVLAARGVRVDSCLTRVDDTQRGRDHEPLVQCAVLVRDDEEARDSRVDRQPCHELAVARELSVRVDRVQ